MFRRFSTRSIDQKTRSVPYLDPRGGLAVSGKGGVPILPRRAQGYQDAFPGLSRRLLDNSVWSIPVRFHLRRWKENKKRVSYLYRTATTAYPCSIPCLGDSAGAGRIRLTRMQRYCFFSFCQTKTVKKPGHPIKIGSGWQDS